MVLSAKALKTAGFVMLGVYTAGVLLALGTERASRVEKKYIQNGMTVKKSRVVQDGWQIWLKKGRKGERNLVKEKVTLFGKEIRSRHGYESELLVKPEKAHIVTGINGFTNPVNVPQMTYAKQVMDMEVTGYDPYPDSGQVDWAGATFLGWRARYGIAAVDPRVIPLRSLIYVEGYGYAWAGDTGGAIKGKRVDLCFNSTSDALRWGRKKVKVYVLGKMSGG